MKTLCYIFILSFFTLSGCSTSKKTISTSEKPDCPTTVEGIFYSREEFMYDVPVIITKKYGEHKIIHGELISTTDSGVVFDPRRESVFLDHEAKFYSFTESNIVCVIDKDSQVAFGKIPETYRRTRNITLQFVDSFDTNSTPVEMKLEANTPFSLCFPSGQYFVKNIFFENKKEFEQGLILPKISLTVTPFMVNYIGDLYLNMRGHRDSSSYEIPFKNFENEKTWAAVGGLIGYLIAHANQDISGRHTLAVESNKDFSTTSKLPLNISPLRFEPNPALLNIKDH